MISAGLRSTSPAWSTPRAEISAAALEQSLHRVLAVTRDAVLDLRMDAWGHGVRLVAPMALEAGAAAVVLDDTMAHLVPPERHAAAHEAAVATGDVFGFDAGPAAMRLAGYVIGVKPLRAGEGVSYGYAHRASVDTRVALVCGGYAQGVVRSLGGRAEVTISGSRHAIVGRVAMDACVVDVGEAPVRRGDEVVFFGDASRGEPVIREWCDATGLTPGEIASLVGARAEQNGVRSVQGGRR